MDSNGNVLSCELVNARRMHYGLGESRESFPSSSFPSGTIGFPALENGIKKMCGPNAVLESDQREALEFIVNRDNKTNACWNAKCGRGKSMAWSATQMALIRAGRELLKMMVIVPYNLLLSQHKGVTLAKFYGNNFVVSAINSKTAAMHPLPEGSEKFDIMFVSIHSYCVLVKEHFEEMKVS